MSPGPGRVSGLGRPAPLVSCFGGVRLTVGDTFDLMLTFETCGDCRISLADRLDTFGLEFAEVFEMTVAGRAMWKLTSAEALSAAPTPAMFSRDRDFIIDSSERVFFGNLDNGESCTLLVCSGRSSS